MSKFNVSKVHAATHGPIATERVASGLTHEGAQGFAHDAKSELFLLAVSNMVGEKTFYEKAGDRDARYEQLVHDVAVADPEWTAGFLGWLRNDANMRSASLVGALEAAKAMIDAKVPGSRKLVASVLQRADEPGEALAYWLATYGKTIPIAVKRGIADAVFELYTEFALLKYDSRENAVRFGDVVELVQPATHRPAVRDTWRSDLYRLAINRRHGNETFYDAAAAGLTMIVANGLLRADAFRDPGRLLDADALKAAGMTWEDVLSLAGSRVDKAKLWTALIPSMGFMALLRNLRGFDEAGVSDAVADQVAARLADPAQVAKSRQFPFRFLSAYEQAPSLRWGHALDRALNACLPNLPTLGGRTLLLVDTSGSMTSQRISEKSTVTAAKAAAVFGVALAAKGENVDLLGFGDTWFRHDLPKGGSVIREVDRFCKRFGEAGHGTQLIGALRSAFDGHDRVVVISDMQIMGHGYFRGIDDAVPANVPLYGFNLGGYKHTAVSGRPNRHEFGGLTDATFKVLPMLESGRDAGWPWEK